MTRHYPTRPVLAVSAAVVRNGAVLLVKRGREPAKGRWGLPGGGVEPGERLADALRREVAEETGVAIMRPRFLTHHEVIEHEDARVLFHYVIAVHAADAEDGTEPVAGDDADEARFVAREDVARLDLTEGTRDVLRGLGWPVAPREGGVTLP